MISAYFHVCKFCIFGDIAVQILGEKSARSSAIMQRRTCTVLCIMYMYMYMYTYVHYCMVYCMYSVYTRPYAEPKVIHCLLDLAIVVLYCGGMRAEHVVAQLTCVWQSDITHAQFQSNALRTATRPARCVSMHIPSQKRARIGRLPGTSRYQVAITITRFALQWKGSIPVTSVFSRTRRRFFAGSRAFFDSISNGPH